MHHSGVYTRNDGTQIFGTPQNLQQWPTSSPQLMDIAPLHQRSTGTSIPLQPSYTNVATATVAAKSESFDTNTGANVLFYMDERVSKV